MYQAKCIEKIRDKNNHIIEYKLISNNKDEMTVKSDGLKESIKSGQIEVTNLTLTSDNRLIDRESVTSSKQNANIERLINRARSLGYNINTFTTACKHKCYIVSSTDYLKHMFIIPDDVKYIYGLLDQQEDIGHNKLYNYMSNIKGTLKVIGGKNLISARYMFSSCKAPSLDLSSFNTSNVTSMNHMFIECKAHSIDLSSFDTSKVTDMGSMFWECKAHSLDLSYFNTSNVTDMSGMFGGCRAQSLDLRSFDTSKVTNMKWMFTACKAHSIDLRSFNTSKVADMSNMFGGCEAQINVTDTKLKHQLQCDRK